MGNARGDCSQGCSPGTRDSSSSTSRPTTSTAPDALASPRISPRSPGSCWCRTTACSSTPACPPMQPSDPPHPVGWNVERRESDPLALDFQAITRDDGMPCIGELNDRSSPRQHVEAFPDDCIAFVLREVPKRKGGDHHRGRAGGALGQKGADASRLALDHDDTRESVLEPPAEFSIPLDEHELLLRDSAREKGPGDAAGPGAEFDDRSPAASSRHARVRHDPCEGLRAWQDRADPARVGGPAPHEEGKSAAAKSRANGLRSERDRRVLSHAPVPPARAADRTSDRPRGNSPRRRPRTADASHSPRRRRTSTER